MASADPVPTGPVLLHHSGSQHTRRLPAHSSRPPCTSGSILNVRYRDSCPESKNPWKQFPRSLGGRGATKRVTSPPRDVSFPSENCHPASSVNSSTSVPGPLLCRWSPRGPFSGTGRPPGIHPLPTCCCQALPPGFTPSQPQTDVKTSNLWASPWSSQCLQPTWETSSPFAPVEHAFQIVLLMSSRGKTMCVHRVTCTPLTQVCKSAMAAITCPTQMPTGMHGLEINLAFMTL